MSLLSLERVSKAYKVGAGLFKTKSFFALHNVSLRVERGELLALVGESGSGKTTLGKLILRLEKPTEGKVFFEGKDLWSYRREYTRLVSAVFQDPSSSLNPRMTVREILEEPLRVHGVKNREEKVLSALKEAGLGEEFLERGPLQLSGGQKQRVAIARAMLLEPKLLVADEPTASLDASLRRDILDLFLKMKAKGVSVLLITHDVRAVQYCADRVAVLYRGRLLEWGTKEQVLKNPLHPYTRYLIQNVPVEHPSQRKSPEITDTPFYSEAVCPFYHLCQERREECLSQLREVYVDGRLVSCNIY
jgi:peptide/nickel transport system ATP-binding protein